MAGREIEGTIDDIRTHVTSLVASTDKRSMAICQGYAGMYVTITTRDDDGGTCVAVDDPLIDETDMARAADLARRLNARVFRDDDFAMFDALFQEPQEVVTFCERFFRDVLGQEPDKRMTFWL